MANLQGKTALVTGSTDGLGRLVARRLAQAGAHVLVHGRSRERGERLVKEIRSAGGSATFYEADLASLAAVRELARKVGEEHPSLHLLVNNAAVGSAGSAGRRETSADGHELRFAVNYLAGFLLTRLLLPAVRRAAPARIVNVASIGQFPLDFDNVMLTRGYAGMRAYAQSKLAQIMFTIDLAEELRDSGVTVNSLHPATYMDTTMVRQAGAQPMSSVDEGADALLRLAVAPEMAGVTGRYFDGQREARANSQAYDAKARERLRALSLQLVDAA